jgi:hypothetical protein
LGVGLKADGLNLKKKKKKKKTLVAEIEEKKTGYIRAEYSKEDYG